MKRFVSLAVIAAALASPIAHAEFYVSGLVGQSTPDEDGFKSDTGIRLAFGMPINENFSIELAYGKLGSFGAESELENIIQQAAEFEIQNAFPDENITVESVSLETDVTSIEIAAIGRYPLSERAGVFARAALTRWDASFEVKGTFNFDGIREPYSDDSESESGTDFAIGVGADMRFTEALYGKVEFSQYMLDDLDVRFIGLGLAYNF